MTTFLSSFTVIKFEGANILLLGYLKYYLIVKSGCRPGRNKRESNADTLREMGDPRRSRWTGERDNLKLLGQPVIELTRFPMREGTFLYRKRQARIPCVINSN